MSGNTECTRWQGRACAERLASAEKLGTSGSIGRKWAFQRFEKEHCNEMWQTDFKGDFLLGNGVRCYPLTILDDHSRFSIRIAPKTSATGVKDSFILAFKEFGLPNSVLSDNGAQFAGAHRGLSQFERFLMDLDILPVHGRPIHPQTQGKIERLHRTLKKEALRVTPANMEEARIRLNNFLAKQWQILTLKFASMKMILFRFSTVIIRLLLSMRLNKSLSKDTIENCNLCTFPMCYLCFS